MSLYSFNKVDMHVFTCADLPRCDSTSPTMKLKKICQFYIFLVMFSLHDCSPNAPTWCREPTICRQQYFGWSSCHSRCTHHLIGPLCSPRRRVQKRMATRKQASLCLFEMLCVRGCDCVQMTEKVENLGKVTKSYISIYLHIIYSYNRIHTYIYVCMYVCI